MSPDQADPQLRFEAGRFEGPIITVVMMTQLLLGAAAMVGIFAILFLSLDLWYAVVVIPSVVVLSVGAYLLSFLYE